MIKKLILTYILALVHLCIFAQYSGSGPITLKTPTGVNSIQWYKDGTAISTATSESYITSVAGTYYAKFTDMTTGCNDDRTINFILLTSGSTVTLDGLSNNSTGTSFQWKKAGSNISGATSATYSTSTGGLYAMSYNNGTCVVKSEDFYVFSLNSVSTAAGTIDCSKTTISPAPTVGNSSQIDLIVSINVTTSGAFTPLSISGSGMSLANGITKVSVASAGIQAVHIPISYDGTALGIMNFSIGSAGSCTADLSTKSKQVVKNIWTLDNCNAIIPGVISK